MANEQSVTKGVTDAFDFWLSQHPVSVPDLIEEAVKKAVKSWLDQHEDEILDRIAERRK